MKHDLATNDIIYYSIALIAFIVVDYITGVVNAAMKGDISSRKMRYGLGHKFSYCVLIFIAYVIDTVQLNSSLNLPFDLFPIVAVGVMLIELTSIIENVCEINPELKKAKFMNIFEKNNDNRKDKNNGN